AVASALFREVTEKMFGIEFRHRRPGTAGKNDRYGNYQDARHAASIARRPLNLFRRVPQNCIKLLELTGSRSQQPGIFAMNDHDTLVALNRDYIDSVQNCDVKRFDEILAEDFYCSN